MLFWHFFVFFCYVLETYHTYYKRIMIMHASGQIVTLTIPACRWPFFN